MKLPLDTAIEEETLRYYEPEQFYPVHIGDLFQGRYRITNKLGYGAYSTSWLCQDVRDQDYLVLKVSTALPRFPTATDREFKIYSHLSQVSSTHPGQSLLRELYDSFELQGDAGSHRCLLLQPMQMTLLDMMKLNPKPFNIPLLKMTLQRILLALDFLHTEAEVIHTDLKTDNLMITLEAPKLLVDLTEEENTNPVARKVLDTSRTIYKSRQFRRPRKGESYGLPVLCDFGEARIGKLQQPTASVQPYIYRAPEIIFDMPWGSAVDIWNLGALIWDLFEGRHLFDDIFDDAGGYDEFKHVALMVAFLGPPPAAFIRRSETTEQCFDSKGAWIADEHAVIPPLTLESVEERLIDSEKMVFLRFLKSMLKWLPEERKTAKQLLDDPWPASS